jgi:cyclic pyranopterin phosphate synthase
MAYSGFIEFMPFGNGDLFEKSGWISSKDYYENRFDNAMALRRSMVLLVMVSRYFLKFGAMEHLVISQMSECFAIGVITHETFSADGILRPCLLNETGQIDLKLGEYVRRI